MSESSAVTGLRDELRPWWGTFTAPIEVSFAYAHTDRDVGHDLGQVPDGYAVLEADGPVTRRPGPWAEKDLAYLRSSVAGTRATVIFFTLRETRNEP